MPDSLIPQTTEFQRELLGWYRHHRRSLPWRDAPSLYKTVVSEFMLQQTQVKTVLPYLARWLEIFPDFAALAAASEEQVVKNWEGLGYYTRARNLHKLARALVATPKVLLLDEPTSGLHAGVIKDLVPVVKAAAEKGIGVLLVEHNLKFVGEVANRVIVLHHGEVIAEGRPDAIMGNPRVIEAYLGGAIGVRATAAASRVQKTSLHADSH